MRRFNGEKKLHSPIELRETLDISEYMEEKNEKKKVVYKLKAVVEHIGDSPRQGHYICYAQDKVEGERGNR